ncbi:MAG: O-acetyl-ADP-ribose deacetylase [Clostridia bacterium]|nr:O-acetyl-ADP-ribose deacetylase [Clostridia bacterium]
MPLEIVRNDITRMEVDAIVNAANTSLLGGGGVDGAIHRAAGPQLLEECKTLCGCKTGDAKITKGYELPSKYVIHTVGPIYQDGQHDERDLLVSCYQNSLELAKEYHCESVAFPLISAGVYGYPKAEALKVAIDTITQFLLENDMTVYIVVFSRDVFEISSKLFSEIQAYIDDVYVDEHLNRPSEAKRRRLQTRYMEKAKAYEELDLCSDALMPVAACLDDMLNQIDESFAEMLIRMIDEKGITDAECYKRANVDRRLFNKIKNNPMYKPSKQTVLAFAIALELSLEETRDMLMKAGFSLSHSNKADIVVEYCIMTDNYNIIEINQVLFKLDLQPLGY